MRKPLAGQQLKTQVSDIEKSLPAPIKGLNSRDPISGMGPADALILENWICQPTELEIRKGQVDFATGFPLGSEIKSLLPYRASPNDKLFAATDAGIFDVTVQGAVGAAVTPCTSGKFESINGSNAGIHYLLAVNGADVMKFYNGSVWADAAVTGVDSKTFTNISQFKFRVFLTVRDSLSFWYLAVNAVQGAAKEYPLAPLFIKGGSLLATGNWTIDGGNGPDDYAVFVTTEGEVAVYSGTDPENINAWSLVGVYSIPRPIGKKCLFKYGGELLVITESGLIKMSKMINATSQNDDSTISNRVVGDIANAVSLYKSNYGWSLTHLSAQNVLILNVPVREGKMSIQYVMNTLTEAWSTFKGFNATCFCEFGARLFYGTSGRVVHALTGQSDFGGNITATVKTAFQGFGYQMKTKQVKLLRANYRSSKSVAVNLAISVNYQGDTYLTPGSALPNNQAVFDVSLWNTATWAEAEFIIDQWRSVSHKPGYTLSLLFQISDKDLSFKWIATDYLISLGHSF